MLIFANHNVKKIVQLYSFITGNHNHKEIIKTLSRSDTFLQVRRNDPVLLYEGYTANLLEIVNELQQISNCPPEIHLITIETVRCANKSIRKSSRKL